VKSLRSRRTPTFSTLSLPNNTRLGAALIAFCAMSGPRRHRIRKPMERRASRPSRLPLKIARRIPPLRTERARVGQPQLRERVGQRPRPPSTKYSASSILRNCLCNRHQWRAGEGILSADTGYATASDGRLFVLLFALLHGDGELWFSVRTPQEETSWTK